MSNVKLRTPVGRVSFPQVFTAKAMQADQKAKFSCSLIFDLEAQKTPEFKALKVRLDELIKEKWPKGAPKNLKYPLKDAENCVTADGRRYTGCEDGFKVLSMQSDFQPEVLDGRNQKKLLTKENEKLFYAGCQAMATCTPAIFDLPTNKGVTCYLGNILKTKDDTAFGGNKPAAAEFEDITIDDECPPADIDF